MIAEADALARMYPRRSMTCGRHAWMTRQFPMRFTSMIASSTSGSRCRSDPPAPIPAFENTTSIPPHASTTSAIAAVT